MTYFIDIVFAGKEFSPNKLKKKALPDLKILAEYGETATYGRFKGKAMPYGLATLGITAESKLQLKETLDEITKKLLDQEAIFVECGVNEISLEAGNEILDTLVSPYALANISHLNKTLETNLSEVKNIEQESIFYKMVEQIFISELEDSHDIKKHIHEIIENKIRQESIKEIINIPHSQLKLVIKLLEYLRKYKNVQKLENIPHFEGIKE